ncbi:MAG: AIDA repeat-containing protein, partial [Victivallaceae bacterium]
MAGYIIYSGITSTGLKLVSNTSMIILDGGKASQTTISSGGSQIVSSGGYANYNYLYEWGYQYVYSGGVVNNNTIHYNAGQTVYAGGIASNTTVSSASWQFLDQGSSFNTTLLYYSIQIVWKGGIAWNTYISSGGKQYVSSGGTASGVTLYGSEWVSNYGVAVDVDIKSGGSQTVSAYGAVFRTTISAYGSQVVQSNAIAEDTIISSGGKMYVSGGEAHMTNISNGGSMIVSSDGRASEATISSGGKMTVIREGHAENIRILSGGLLALNSGAIAEGRIYLAGGAIDVDGADLTYAQMIADLSTAAPLSISHAMDAAYNKAPADENYLAYDASFAVNLDHEQQDGIYAVVDFFAPQNSVGFMIDGADNFSVTIGEVLTRNNYTYILMENRALRDSGYISILAAESVEQNPADLQLLLIRNTNYQDLVLDASSPEVTEIYCNCTLTGATVSDDRYLCVNRGASASGIVVNFGNVIARDCALDDTRVKSGTVIAAGCAVKNTIVSSGGNMLLTDGSVHSGTMTLYGAVIASGATIDFAINGKKPFAGYLINDLSLISGGSFTLTVSADQNTGIYTLANHAESFSTTITVKDSDGKKLGVIAMDESIFLSESKVGELTIYDDSILVFRVSDISAEPVKIYSAGTLVAQAESFTGETIVGGGNDLVVVSSGGVLDSCAILSGGSAAFSGGSANSLSILSGGSAAVSGGQVLFDNLIMSGNVFSSGTAMNISSGNVTLLGGTIFDNTGCYSGGAICVGNCNLEVSGTIFSGNLTPGFDDDNPFHHGGAISTVSATVNIHNAAFVENHADGDGGAIYTANSNLTLSKVDFTKNSASAGNYCGGGAISWTSWNNQIDCFVSISDCRFRSNNFQAQSSNFFGGFGGGAAFLVLRHPSDTASFSIAGSLFSNNSTSNIASETTLGTFLGGGAVLLIAVDNAGGGTISDTIFSRNVTRNSGKSDDSINGGGAVYIFTYPGNTFDFSGCEFAGNSAVASAIYNSGPQTVQAAICGGAVCVTGSGSTVFANTLFNGNSACFSGTIPESAAQQFYLYGGAVYAGQNNSVRFEYAGSRYLNQGNSATAGGFLYLASGTDAVFDISSATCEFSSNSADSGGFMYLNGGTATFNLNNGVIIIGHDPIDDEWTTGGVPAQEISIDSIAGSGTIVINGDRYSNFQLRGDASQFTGNWVITENTYMSLHGYGHGINNLAIASGATVITVQPVLSGADVAAGGILAVLNGSGSDLNIFGTLKVGTTQCGKASITNAVIHSGGMITRFDDEPYNVEWYNMYYDSEPLLTNVIMESGAYANMGNFWGGRVFKLGCADYASEAILNTVSAAYSYWENGTRKNTSAAAITSGYNLAVLSGAAVLSGDSYNLQIVGGSLTAISGAVVSGLSMGNGTRLNLYGGAAALFDSGAAPGSGTTLNVDLAGHTADGGASVRNLASLDGVTLTVNADSLSADCGTFILVSGVTAESITVSLAGTAYD